MPDFGFGDYLVTCGMNCYIIYFQWASSVTAAPRAVNRNLLLELVHEIRYNKQIKYST